MTNETYFISRLILKAQAPISPLPNTAVVLFSFEQMYALLSLKHHLEHFLAIFQSLLQVLSNLVFAHGYAKVITHRYRVTDHFSGRVF